MNAMWADLQRGMDRPDLIMVDNVFWAAYVASLQAQQRFTGSSDAAVKMKNVILDGDISDLLDIGTAFHCFFPTTRPQASHLWAY